MRLAVAILAVFSFVVSGFVAGPAVFAQDNYDGYDSEETEETGTSDVVAAPDTAVTVTVTAVDADSDKPFYTLSYGAAASWLNRMRNVIRTIPELDGAGNPVDRAEEIGLTYRDFFPGLYLNMEVYNVQNPFKDMTFDIVPLIRLAAYLPLSYYADTSTINREPQRSEKAGHFGIDMLAGIKLEPLDSDYVRFSITPALHLLFFSSDKGNYFNLGGAGILGIEVPLNEKWTFQLSGCVSVDSGNLGSNRDTEPFDSCSQYQVGIGFRYSAKKLNKFSLFGPKSPKKDTSAEYDEYE
ncbi:MAG: hypothetical protein LBG95_09225 [Treponema sp.]|jgi:hypothetical protein|nr:hypothetical protein [Treponema sp.]